MYYNILYIMYYILYTIYYILLQYIIYIYIYLSNIMIQKLHLTRHLYQYHVLSSLKLVYDQETTCAFCFAYSLYLYLFLAEFLILLKQNRILRCKYFFSNINISLCSQCSYVSLCSQKINEYKVRKLG